ncbi:hypothetical protein LCGC14_1107390 [marine sediment metagenome]|uniref:Terminase large subunit gp17-like C-terminal domain-containing protein n=1 Tax=marine sediment metagenome TaxID=412755 RepID=A0A0F9M7S6_9ZZZZ
MHQHIFDLPLLHTYRLKKPPTPWRDICTTIKFEGAHTTPMRQYNEWLKDKGPHLNTSPTESNNPPLMSDLGKIRRLKYGSIEPTGHISRLDHLSWMRLYFGHHKYRWDFPYLTALQDLLWEGNDKLGHVPRFGGKTVTYLGMTAKELVERKEPLLTICSPKRVKILFRAMIVRMGSPQLRKDYGDMIAVDDGRVQIDRTERMIWISDKIPYNYEDPWFRVASRETDIIGSHPAHLHFEDISQRESEHATNKLIEWCEDVVVPMLSLEKGVIARKTGTSTRKGPDDFDNYLMTTQGWTNKGTHFRAMEGYIPNIKDVTLDEYGNVVAINKEARDNMEILNPNWDPIKLINIAIKTPISWASQYQNEPIARGGIYFTKDDIYISDSSITHFTQNKEYSDPAWGTSSKKKTVIIVVSIYNYALHILDASIGKFDTNKIGIETVRMARQWKTIKTKLENNFAQYKSRFDVDSPLLNLRGVQLFNQDKNKLQRISALKGPLSTGRIRIHPECSFKNEIINEILSYDESKKPWDILDTIAQAYEDNARWMSPTAKSKIKVGVQSPRFEE